MKKLFTTLAVAGFAAAAFAQGTVQWTGVAGSLIVQTNSGALSSFSVPGASLPSGPQAIGSTAGSGTTLFYYELLVSTTQSTAPTTYTSLSTGWADTGLGASNGTGANGRILQLNSGTAVTAANWASGVTKNVILVGWSANLGTTYAQALAYLQSPTQLATPGFFGISSVGSLAAAPGDPGVIVFGTGAGQINNGSTSPMQLTVVGVPEPATMVLAGLGGLSLLALRRKK